MFEFSKRFVGYVLLVALTIFGVATMVHAAVWWAMPWAFLEAALYTVLFLVYFALTPIRRYFLSLPIPHRAIFISFFSLMLIGQLADRSWLTFPFPNWSMYTKRDSSGPILFLELRGLMVDGTAYKIDPSRLAGGRLTLSMATKLQTEAEGAFFSRSSEGREQHKQKLGDFMRAAGRIHNQRNPDQTVGRVELYCVKINRQAKDEKAFERTKLWDVSL